ncbi:hypothetical protein HJC23_009675 [Cyclotella cryptica]|uniref:Uncharacterized protein n=1 Tax=Cyclotella cryptica TaxID=29204 RepID=A0ABD3Q9F9_9STRA|eukprot:CCRYP_007624-RA/>CCRYP_007624-RA protein AED:0.16 eAED:0.16 QI:0/-1/0/1/-1/1/1/0/374
MDEGKNSLDENDVDSIVDNLKSTSNQDGESIDREIYELKSESTEIIEVKRASKEQMWTMQPPQPYIPQYPSSEEEIPINLGRAKVKSPTGGHTHFNIFLNQSPQPQQTNMHPQPPMGMPYGGWSPPPVYNMQPSPQTMFTPPMYNCYPPYGMPQQQQPTVVVMNPQQPKPPSPKPDNSETPKPDGDKKPTPPPSPAPTPPSPTPPSPPPKPPTDHISPVCIASIIIAIIGFMMGVASIVKSDQAYQAHINYQEQGNGSESSALFETWQMARNIALGAGASSVVIYSLAFLLVFWSGMHHKMKRKVVSGCCMTLFLIGGWIVFAFSFVVDVVVLVLAFDVDNVVYPEIVWAAFIGHNVSWLLMLVNSEMARRWVG